MHYVLHDRISNSIVARGEEEEGLTFSRQLKRAEREALFL
jgi:hypothetical protein